jgi:FKBP-type peptidyl-prolyl cis-trans isomerase
MNIRTALIAMTVMIWISCNTDPAVSTIMGYEYDHVVQNDAKRPAPGEYVFYNYYLRNNDGELLEASNQKNAVSEFRIPPADAYPKKAPLIELMKIMAVGDSARLHYPIDSLPESGRARFGDVTELIYEVVIKDVKTEAEYAVIKEERDSENAIKLASAQAKEETIKDKVADVLSKYKAGALTNDIRKAGDLEYIIHEEGTGAQGDNGQTVKAHYYGVLKSDGSMFDNSFSRGQPFEFVLGKGQVISGWDQGFRRLKAGSKATLFIPYTMAYGENGRPPAIPEKADLVFYVELEEVK